MLARPALERRASGVPGSREAPITPRTSTRTWCWAHNPDLPPPFSIDSFRRYVRWAWLCEGAAAWLSGQTRHLRPAIVRRLREGGRPEFRPTGATRCCSAGPIFTLLERAGRRGGGGARHEPAPRWRRAR